MALIPPPTMPSRHASPTVVTCPAKDDKHVTQGPGTRSQKTVHRYDNHKLDKTMYRDSLSELLTPFQLHLIDLAVAVDILQLVVDGALVISAPAKKPRGKWKKKIPLDPVIREAAEHSKHCYYI